MFEHLYDLWVKTHTTESYKAYHGHLMHTHTHINTHTCTLYLPQRGVEGIKMAIGVPKYIFIQKTGELIMV